jgi:hypothetical protein
LIRLHGSLAAMDAQILSEAERCSACTGVEVATSEAERHIQLPCITECKCSRGSTTHSPTRPSLSIIRF